MSVEYRRTAQGDSEPTTNVPLLEANEDSDLFTPFDRQSVEDTDSLEGHVITVRNPSKHCPAPISKQAKFVVVFIIIFALLITCIVLGILLKKRKDACENTAAKQSEPREFCLREGCIDTAHYMIHSLDNKTDPCVDFFQYACGGWVQNHPIPGSKSFWGIYSVLWEENQSKLRNLLSSPSISDTKSTAVKKAKQFYDSCMDEDSIDKLDAQPLKEVIENIGGWNITTSADGKLQWSGSKDFLELLKVIQRNQSVPVFFNTDVDVDDKNSSRNIIKVRRYLNMLPVLCLSAFEELKPPKFRIRYYLNFS